MSGAGTVKGLLSDRRARRRSVAAIFLFFVALALGSCGPVRRPLAVSSPRYDLLVRISDKADEIGVRGTLFVTSNSTSHGGMTLNLASRMKDLVVTAMVDGDIWPTTVELQSVGKTTTAWSILPHHPFPAARPISLTFAYHGGGPTGTMFHVGKDVTFASGWGSDWYPSISDQKATGVITIRVKPGDRAVASDCPLSTPEEESRGIFRFEIARPTYFTFAAGHFATTRAGTDTPIIAYTLEPRPQLATLLAGVAQIVKILGNEFGPMPPRQLALVEIPRDVAQEAGFNAASLPGIVMLNSNAFKAPKVDFLLEWLGHELSHQWFPHQIAFRTPPGLYMEEALAQYGGMTAVDAMLGPAAAEQSRRTGFEYDPNYSADAYFKLLKKGIDVPLSRLENKPGHRDLAYNKGSFVFWMLADQLGRDRFRKVLKGITGSGFRELTWPEFLRAVESGSGRELGWFFGQWFDRPGAPNFDLDWHASSQGAEGRISQTGPAYRARLEVAVEAAGGERRIQVVNVAGPETSFTVRTHGRPISVALDPHYRVMRWLPGTRPYPQPGLELKTQLKKLRSGSN